jgi:hypothetical protein
MEGWSDDRGHQQHRWSGEGVNNTDEMVRVSAKHKWSGEGISNTDGVVRMLATKVKINSECISGVASTGEGVSGVVSTGESSSSTWQALVRVSASSMEWYALVKH